MESKLDAVISKLSEIEALIENSGKEINDETIIEVDNILQNFLQNTSIESVRQSVKFINKSDNIDPKFAYEGDSGFDLRSTEDVCIQPFDRYLVSTGLFFELEKGFEIQVRPRSGLAIKYGVTVLNSPGTVDSHYRGEVKVPLINLGKEPFTISKGDRIAQAVVMPVFGEGNINLVKVDEINETTRSQSGFNSSGVK